MWVKTDGRWLPATVTSSANDETQELTVVFEDGREGTCQLHSPDLTTINPYINDDELDADEQQTLDQIHDRFNMHDQAMAAIQTEFNGKIAAVEKKQEQQEETLAEVEKEQARYVDMASLVDRLKQLELDVQELKEKQVTPESLKKLQAAMGSVDFDELVDISPVLPALATSPVEVPIRPSTLEGSSMQVDLLVAEIVTTYTETTDPQRGILHDWSTEVPTWDGLVLSFGIPTQTTDVRSYWPFKCEAFVRSNPQHAAGFVMVDALTGMLRTMTPSAKKFHPMKKTISIEPATRNLNLSPAEWHNLSVPVVALLTSVCNKPYTNDLPADAALANRTYNAPPTRAAAVAANAALTSGGGGSSAATPGSTSPEYTPSPASGLIEYRDSVLFSDSVLDTNAPPSASYSMGAKLLDCFEFIDWEEVDARHWTDTVGFVCQYDPSEHSTETRGDAGRKTFAPLSTRKDRYGNVLVALNSGMIKQFKSWPRNAPKPADNHIVHVKPYKTDCRQSVQQLLGSLYIVADFPPPLLQPKHEFVSSMALLDTLRGGLGLGLGNGAAGYSRHDALIGNVDRPLVKTDRRLRWYKGSKELRNSSGKVVGHYGTALAPGPLCLHPASSAGNTPPAVPKVMMWHALTFHTSNDQDDQDDQDDPEQVVLLSVTKAPPGISLAPQPRDRKRKLVFQQGSKRKQRKGAKGAKDAKGKGKGKA